MGEGLGGEGAKLSRNASYSSLVFTQRQNADEGGSLSSGPHPGPLPKGEGETHGFLVTLCVDRTRPGDCDPRVSSTTTRFSRRYIVNRLPSVVPCSSSTCAGLPFRIATSSAVVNWHQSPVPRL